MEREPWPINLRFQTLFCAKYRQQNVFRIAMELLYLFKIVLSILIVFLSVRSNFKCIYHISMNKQLVITACMHAYILSEKWGQRKN